MTGIILKCAFFTANESLLFPQAERVCFNGNFFPSRRGKGRTQLSMMPRALQRQSNPVAKAENGMVQNSPAASSDPPAEPKKMSNADFAKMLLKK